VVAVLKDAGVEKRERAPHMGEGSGTGVTWVGIWGGR
jgi:hypothetical protein